MKTTNRYALLNDNRELRDKDIIKWGLSRDRNKQPAAYWEKILKGTHTKLKQSTFVSLQNQKYDYDNCCIKKYLKKPKKILFGKKKKKKFS